MSFGFLHNSSHFSKRSHLVQKCYSTSTQSLQTTESLENQNTYSNFSKNSEIRQSEKKFSTIEQFVELCKKKHFEQAVELITNKSTKPSFSMLRSLVRDFIEKNKLYAALQVILLFKVCGYSYPKAILSEYKNACIKNAFHRGIVFLYENHFYELNSVDDYIRVATAYTKIRYIPKGRYILHMCVENIQISKEDYIPLIEARTKTRQPLHALDLVEEACKHNIKVSPSLYAKILAIYPHYCSLECFQTLLKMKDFGIQPDTACYTVVINRLARARDFEKLIQVVEMMLSDGVNPSLVTLVKILRGLNQMGYTETVNDMFAKLEEHGVNEKHIRLMKEALENRAKLEKIVGFSRSEFVPQTAINDSINVLLPRK